MLRYFYSKLYNPRQCEAMDKGMKVWRAVLRHEWFPLVHTQITWQAWGKLGEMGRGQVMISFRGHSRPLVFIWEATGGSGRVLEGEMVSSDVSFGFWHSTQDELMVENGSNWKQRDYSRNDYELEVRAFEIPKWVAKRTQKHY